MWTQHSEGLERERGGTGYIVHILVDDNVQPALGILVRRYVGRGEGFRHLEGLSFYRSVCARLERVEVVNTWTSVSQ
jgi:hypothetical protein